MKTTILTWLVVLGTWVGAGRLGAGETGAASTGVVVQPEDRIVFYGDSITEQRLYSRYVQQYLYCRYPELNLSFYNAGWSGDTASGARGRLERDVLHLKPSLVTLCFGMNDGNYARLKDDIVDSYRGALSALIKDLQGAKVRVAVFAPSCVDYTRSATLASNEYNVTLAALAEAAIDVARESRCVAWTNLHPPMVKYQTAQQAANPGFSMVPDAIHPDPKGHVFMAAVMLRGLRAEPFPPLGSADLLAGQFKGVRLVTQSVSEVVLETRGPMPVPFWFDASWAGGVVKDSGLIKLVAQKLTVKGLAKGKWRVFIDDTRAGKFEAEEYAAGVMIDGSYSARGRLLHELIERKEGAYYDLWRNVRLAGLAAGTRADILDALVSADDAYQQAIRLASQPTTLRIVLRQVQDSPTPAP